MKNYQINTNHIINNDDNYEIIVNYKNDYDCVCVFSHLNNVNVRNVLAKNDF